MMKFIPLVFVKDTPSTPPKSFLVGSIKQGFSSPQEAEEAAKAWLKGLRELATIDAMPGHVSDYIARKGLSRGYLRYFPGVEE